MISQVANQCYPLLLLEYLTPEDSWLSEVVIILSVVASDVSARFKLGLGILQVINWPTEWVGEVVGSSGCKKKCGWKSTLVRNLKNSRDNYTINNLEMFLFQSVQIVYRFSFRLTEDLVLHWYSSLEQSPLSHCPQLSYHFLTSKKYLQYLFLF